MYKIKLAGEDVRKSQPVIRLMEDNFVDEDILMEGQEVPPILEDDNRDGEAQIPDVQKSLYDLTQGDMDDFIELPEEKSDDYESRYKDKLDSHRKYVREALDLLRQYIPSLMSDYHINELLLNARVNNHDLSKYKMQEFPHYARHYFGTQTLDSEREYMSARLHHIHGNPHHWHYWCYPVKGQIMCVDMPNEYIMEMICDWLSFGLADGNPLEIMEFYGKNKDIIFLSSATRAKVEAILQKIYSTFGGK